MILNKNEPIFPMRDFTVCCDRNPEVFINIDIVSILWEVVMQLLLICIC